MNFSFDEALALIEEKKQADKKRHLTHFEEEPEMEVMNGRYGPYMAYKGKNYRLTKAQAAKADQLTLEECLKIVGA